MKFKTIKTSTNLIQYLDDINKRLKDCDYLSHYTNYDKLLKILNSKKIFLSKADNMNDMLEYKNGDKNIWDKLYFMSLIMNRRENIGMWAVYSQPWNKSVKITFMKKDVQEWLSNLDKIYIVEKNEKIKEKPIKINKEKVFLSSVAYTNTESLDMNTEIEKVTWNTVENTNFHKASKKKELTGYIKDAAWSYEREIRVKVMFNHNITYHRIALDISSLMQNMIITTGPLFEGSIYQKLMMDLSGVEGCKFTFDQSIFQNNFKI